MMMRLRRGFPRRRVIVIRMLSMVSCSSQGKFLRTQMVRSLAPAIRQSKPLQCLENLRTLVELRGFAIEDIRHLTVYVVGEHQSLLDAWGAVTTWFGQDVPPATLLGVNLLGHTGQLVEIDAKVVR
jgi:enamine deaminase RidA (YjgF/YER057c/UK114 family)